MAKEIFNTVFTSRRHRELGYCETSDFATIKLIYQDKEEANFYIKTNEKVIYKYKNYLYCNVLLLPFSRTEDKKWQEKQGKFRHKTAIQLMLDIRKGNRERFSCISNEEFLLIGRTLYQKYCKVNDLCVTICGNMLFGNWLSINIEPKHSNKTSTRLTVKSYNRIIKKQTEFYNKYTKKEHKDAGLHIEKIKKWGKM